MKERYIIIVMLIVLFMLTINLLDGEETQESYAIDISEFESSDELEVFVTIEMKLHTIVIV